MLFSSLSYTTLPWRSQARRPLLSSARRFCSDSPLLSLRCVFLLISTPISTIPIVYILSLLSLSMSGHCHPLRFVQKALSSCCCRHRKCIIPPIFSPMFARRRACVRISLDLLHARFLQERIENESNHWCHHRWKGTARIKVIMTRKSSSWLDVHHTCSSQAAWPRSCHRLQLGRAGHQLSSTRKGVRINTMQLSPNSSHPLLNPESCSLFVEELCSLVSHLNPGSCSMCSRNCEVWFLA